MTYISLVKAQNVIKKDYFHYWFLRTQVAKLFNVMLASNSIKTGLVTKFGTKEPGLEMGKESVACVAVFRELLHAGEFDFYFRDLSKNKMKSEDPYYLLRGLLEVNEHFLRLPPATIW